MVPPLLKEAGRPGSGGPSVQPRERDKDISYNPINQAYCASTAFGRLRLAEQKAATGMHRDLHEGQGSWPLAGARAAS